jgi:hypothetical protein
MQQEVVTYAGRARVSANPESRADNLRIPGSLVSLAPSDAPIGASGNDDVES